MIEKHNIWLSAPTPARSYWNASVGMDTDSMDGPTPLIAAMRALVFAKLGDEVDVPDELLGAQK